MKPSQLLRKVAKYQHLRRYDVGACEAITEAGRHVDCLTRLFARLYLRLCKPPPPVRDCSYWFGNPWESTNEQHTQRQLAMLFAAEIAESEGY